MAFELLINFTSPDISERLATKQRLMAWLESVGRDDYVEGVIDGVEMRLTDEETDSGLTDEDRLADSPIAIFDATESLSKELWRELHEEFGSSLRMAISEISDDSWQQCWREEFSPFASSQFFVAPLGEPAATPPGLKRIEIDAAGGAFGTGQHSTTRAVITVLEDHVSIWKPASVLDVGTGTGIYLIICHLLGVKVLTGTEISSELVELALQNCDAANVKADIRLLDCPDFDSEFDLIIANILVPVLHDLMPDLVKTLTSKGRLVVAGFVDKEQHRLVERALSFGLIVESETNEDGWKCLVFSNDRE